MARKSIGKSIAKKTMVLQRATNAIGGLAELFQKARIEAGYNISSLAAHAVVSTIVIHDLETAPEKVPLEDLYAVANVLNLDPGVVLEFLHSATR